MLTIQASQIVTREKQPKKIVMQNKVQHPLFKVSYKCGNSVLSPVSIFDSDYGSKPTVDQEIDLRKLLGLLIPWVPRASQSTSEVTLSPGTQGNYVGSVRKFVDTYFLSSRLIVGIVILL